MDNARKKSYLLNGVSITHDYRLFVTKTLICYIKIMSGDRLEGDFNNEAVTSVVRDLSSISPGTTNHARSPQHNERPNASGGSDSSKQEIESTIAREVESVLPVAEDIARIRLEMETKIFFEGLPKSEWKSAYEEIIAEYVLLSNKKYRSSKC